MKPKARATQDVILRTAGIKGDNKPKFLNKNRAAVKGACFELVERLMAADVSWVFLT